MNTKIVYALVSNDNDIYLEQTLVSIYSLRLYNSDAKVILVVDEDTDKTIQGKRSEILKYINEKISVKVPKQYSQVQRSRYLKTTLRQYISGDYLFIDSDTIITSKLNEIDSFPYEIGAVKDYHLNLKEIPGFKELQKKAQIINWNITDKDIAYFNSGVIVAKDTPTVHQLYKTWHSIWLESIQKKLNVDQPSLGKANAECNYPIKELDGIWNCQILMRGLKYLHQAHIIHYFSSTRSFTNNTQQQPIYFFLATEIFYDIKKLGYISETLSNQIKNAQSAFSFNYEIYYGKNLDFTKTTICKISRHIYFHYPRLFNFIENIIKFFFKKS